jgi:hypothetical protein
VQFCAEDCPSAPPSIVEARAVSGSGKGILRLGSIDFYESGIIVPYYMYTYVRRNA